MLMNISLGPVDWGNAPSWVAAVLSVGSIWIALYVLNRDGKRHEREQAVKVVCWYSDDDLRRKAFLHNTSDQPVVDPALRILPKGAWKLWLIYARAKLRSRPKVSLTRVLSVQQKHEFADKPARKLDPGQNREKLVLLEGAIEFYDFALVFYDATGREWMRKVPGGDILSPRRVRSIQRRVKRVDRRYKGSRAKVDDDMEKLERQKKRAERVPLSKRSIFRS